MWIETKIKPPGKPIYDNKIMPTFDQMPDIQNVPTSDQKITAFTTFDTEEIFILEEQNIPAKEKMTSKYQKREKLRAYYTE